MNNLTTGGSISFPSGHVCIFCGMRVQAGDFHSCQPMFTGPMFANASTADIDKAFAALERLERKADQNEHRVQKLKMELRRERKWLHGKW